MNRITDLTLKICACFLICGQVYAKSDCPSGTTKYLIAASIERSLMNAWSRNFNLFVCSALPLDTEDAFKNIMKNIKERTGEDNVTILNAIPLKD